MNNINLPLPEELLDTLDQARGDVPRTVWIRRAIEQRMQHPKLSLIGRDYSLIQILAKQIHKTGTRGRSITKLYETADRRGFYYEVQIMDPDDKQPTGHIARVQVTLDRFDQETAQR
jgi:hypothetical protein